MIIVFLDLSVGSGKCISPNSLTKSVQSQLVGLQVDGLPVSAHGGNEKSVDCPAKKLDPINGLPKSAVALNFPAGVPDQQGCVSTVYAVTGSGAEPEGDGDKNRKKSGKDKTPKQPKEKKLPKEPKKAKEPKQPKEVKSKTPKEAKPPKPSKETKPAKEIKPQRDHGKLDKL